VWDFRFAVIGTTSESRQSSLTGGLNFGVHYTCHVFAAGYPLGGEADYADTFGQFDRLIGLSRLYLFHLNDSVKPLGSRVDRHAAIGQGMIGEEPFRRLARDSRFADTPMVLETPKEDDSGNPMDPVNLALLKSFLADPPAGRAVRRKRRVGRSEPDPA
jgi:deoxyribonuclease-4